MKYKVGKPHYKLSFIYSFIIIFWAVFLIIYSPFSGMNICGFMLIFLIIFIFLPSMAFVIIFGKWMNIILNTLFMIV